MKSAWCCQPCLCQGSRREGPQEHVPTSPPRPRRELQTQAFFLTLWLPGAGPVNSSLCPKAPSEINWIYLTIICLSVSVHLPIRPSVHLIYLSIVLPSTDLPTYLPIHPSITCLSNLYLAVCLILLCVFFKVLCMYYSLLNYRVILNVTVIIQCCSPAALVPYIKLGHSSVGSLFPFSHWLVHTRVETVLLKLDSCIKENVHWSFSH